MDVDHAAAAAGNAQNSDDADKSNSAMEWDDSTSTEDEEEDDEVDSGTASDDCGHGDADDEQSDWPADDNSSGGASYTPSQLSGVVLRRRRYGNRNATASGLGPSASSTLSIPCGRSANMPSSLASSQGTSGECLANGWIFPSRVEQRVERFLGDAEQRELKLSNSQHVPSIKKMISNSNGIQVLKRGRGTIILRKRDNNPAAE
jgi:hypothetical protein